MANHVAAIHVLKARLRLHDDAYRDLLAGLVGKRSCSAMAVPELLAVRGHLENLVRQYGLAVGGPARGPARAGRLSPAEFETAKNKASPRQRKAWALWHQLHRSGQVRDPSAGALNHYVQRQVQVSALAFCTGAQLDTVIESLKRWLARGTPA